MFDSAFSIVGLSFQFFPFELVKIKPSSAI